MDIWNYYTWPLNETQIDDEASPNKGQELRIIATKMYITL